MKGENIKGGNSTTYKRQDRSMTYEKMPLRVRAQLHQERHPNDKNAPRKNKGVTFGKKTQRDKDLEEFHKNHVWTYIDAEMNKGWVYTGE